MDNTEFTTNYTDVVANRVDPDNKVIANLNIVDNTEFTTNYTDVVANRVDPDNKVIANLNIVDNTEFTTNYTDVVPTESTPTTRLSPTSTSRTTPSSRLTPRTWIPAEPSRPTLTMRPSTLTTMKAETTLTLWSRLGSILTSTWQGFLDNFEVMDGMTEGVQREPRDQISQISRPRIEEAESSRLRRETTNLGQPGSRTFTSATSSTTSTATSTVSLTAVSERMPSPTPAVQPHWKTPTKLTTKGKELENKSVKDQRPGFKENDMRDHLSGYNDEDEDHLKLDIERPDEEEDQAPTWRMNRMMFTTKVVSTRIWETTSYWGG